MSESEREAFEREVASQKNIQNGAASTSKIQSNYIGKTLINDLSTHLPKYVANAKINNENEVLASSIPKPNRILPPNSVTTKEYMQNRINIHIDDSNKIVNVNYN